jgi:hypothetical protein
MALDNRASAWQHHNAFALEPQNCARDKVDNVNYDAVVVL